MADATAPSIFVNHGGGPFPVLGQKDNLEIAQSLKNIRDIVNLKSLKAIILVTAHWETDTISISSGEKHNLLYDYSNFPPETYLYKYEAKGNPILAQRIHDALSKRGIPSTLDDERGWDHGVFIPMMLIRPEADIPIVQVSILKNQDAKKHYELGEVLGEFQKENIAVIGSGLSYHNMEKMRKAEEVTDGVKECVEFDKFVNDVCTGDVREEILKWREAPESFDAHPEGEADHFMPLIVAAAAGGASKGRNVFKSAFYDKFLISGFIWE